MEEISTTSISSLHTHRDETSFLKELVAQFLAHDGFVETARIFAQEVRDESRALQFGNHAFQDELSTEEDLDASNRQRK